MDFQPEFPVKSYHVRIRVDSAIDRFPTRVFHGNGLISANREEEKLLQP
jgi:hypothetical protein